jgi:hypothetical protein
MPFFARPNLDNTQFKQLSGTTLTLSGTTIFSKYDGGLTFADENGTNIPVVILSSGASEQNVLKYVSGCIVLGQVSTGGTSTGYYDCRTPATCTVGGLVCGTTLTGRTIANILEEVLAPVVCPTLTSPSSTFTVSCLPITFTGYYEMGSVVCATGCSIFNQGCICPAYCGSCDKRSGLPDYHYYGNWGSYVTCTTSSLTNSIAFTPYPINNPSQSVSGQVFYSAATCCVLKSDGTCWCSPLPSGSTAAISRYVCGTYPWFWGSSATTPATGQTLISGYTCKCVDNGNATIVVDNFNVTDEYIWFATPYASCSKTCWQGANNPSNNGLIPGALFGNPACVNIISPELCWGSTCYKIYVSSYKTSINYGMTFCN